MTYKIKGFFYDDAVVFDSAEYRRKLAGGWVLVGLGEGGFCTMRKKEGAR